MKKTFLVVSPHPDDAELGIGGTILKLKSQGHTVVLVDLTSGEPTPYGSQRKRREEAKRAAKILGVDVRANLGLENRYLRDSKEARLLLAEKIRLVRPDVVLCPYLEDAHPDHLAATQITEAARFYAKYTKTKLEGKPHYVFYLFYYFCSHLRVISQVSFLVDISQEFERKMKAIRCYRSQFVDNPKNTFVFDYIQTRDRFLGGLIRQKYAEGLYSKEAVKVDDISHFL